MKYILMPSLERIALVEIVATLWNQERIRVLTMACFHEFSELKKYGVLNGSEWPEIEETVMEKVSQLLLPQLIEDRALRLVKPIGIQILKWMQYHFETLHLCNDLPVEFCWTTQGTVDRKRTAQTFIKNENLDISKRYEWACVYCLVDDIPKLWMKMPDHFKQSFLNKLSLNKDHWRNLVSFWTWNMEQGEKDDIDFTYRYLLYYPMKGNKEATEHLLTKLTSVKRELYMQIVCSIADCVDDPDVLCFLLSEMDEEKQMVFLRSCDFGVLKNFLNWPLQSFFIETVTRVWDFLDKIHYIKLLNSILWKHLDGFRDWNYPKLWGEVWEKGSVAFKNYVIDESDYALLKRLLWIKDKENCRLMLKDAAAIEKKEFIHCDRVQSICLDLFCCNKWDLLEFFIQECISSKDEMLQFKEELEKRIKNCFLRGIFLNDHLMKNKLKWDALFCLSDNSVSKNDKRRKFPSVEEGQSSSSKRLRSLQ